MSGTVEGWHVNENATAAWARSPGGRYDLTIDADGGLTVEIETKDAGTIVAEVPIAVLREVLRRVDAKGKP